MKQYRLVSRTIDRPVVAEGGGSALHVSPEGCWHVGHLPALPQHATCTASCLYCCSFLALRPSLSLIKDRAQQSGRVSGKMVAPGPPTPSTPPPSPPGVGQCWWCALQCRRALRELRRRPTAASLKISPFCAPDDGNRECRNSTESRLILLNTLFKT